MNNNDRESDSVSDFFASPGECKGFRRIVTEYSELGSGQRNKDLILVLGDACLVDGVCGRFASCACRADRTAAKRLRTLLLVGAGKKMSKGRPQQATNGLGANNQPVSA